MAEKQKNEMDEREIGALWEKESKNGAFFTGDVNGQKIVIFKNKFKEDGDKKPTWRIYKDKPLDNKSNRDDDIPL